MFEPDPQRRLAEMDARLAAIQAGLEEDLDPSGEVTAAPPPPPPPPAEAPPVASPPRSWSLRPASPPAPPLPAPLEAMCARLLRSMRELMAGYEIALAHVAAAPPGDRQAPAVTLAAGPFSAVEMVERFEDTLRSLPEVASVALRGYEGSDRAIVEVRLRA